MYLFAATGEANTSLIEGNRSGPYMISPEFGLRQLIIPLLPFNVYIRSLCNNIDGVYGPLPFFPMRQHFPILLCPLLS